MAELLIYIYLAGLGISFLWSMIEFHEFVKDPMDSIAKAIIWPVRLFEKISDRIG